MDYLKKFIGFAIGFAAVWAAIHFMRGGDKLKEMETFRSNEGRFSVLMPGTPEKNSQSVDTAAGKIELIMFMAGSRQMGFAAAYADYPSDAVNLADADKVLDGARDGTVRNVNGELISESKIDFHGHSGREIQIKVKNQLNVKVRMFLVGPRLYQLMFIAPLGEIPEDKVLQFFNSFTVDGL